MKHAIIFPGQGSQSLGMLADLASNFPIVQTIFAEASEALGFDLWALTQNDKAGLEQTQNTQPAMLAAGYATYQVLKHETDLSPIYMAGHSLGEYTALTASGALRFADGVKLVRRRGELMQSAVPTGVGAMAAILGLEDENVIKICADYSGEGVVEAVNFNAIGQVVIAGNKSAVEATCDLMKTVGAKRAVLLPVSVPSHCSLMNTAAVAFRNTVDAVAFNQSKVAVLHNVDACKSENIDELKNKLVLQLHKPVLWKKTVQVIVSSGVLSLIESGPGKVLTGLSRRIDKNIKALAVFDTKSLQGVTNG